VLTCPKNGRHRKGRDPHVLSTEKKKTIKIKPLFRVATGCCIFTLSLFHQLCHISGL